MDALLHTFSFLAVLVVAFWLPGFVWWRAVFGQTFSLFEECVYAFLGSLVLIDLIMLGLGRAGVPLSATVIGGTLGLITALGALFAWRGRKNSKVIAPTPSGMRLSTRGQWLFLTIITLTLFIRTLYLVPNMLPTATDLGHHVYWAQHIVSTQSLPTYEKIEIVTDPVTQVSAIAPPKPIADFIIGEHLPIAFLSAVSGLTFTSAFPILFLHLINIFSILAVAALAFRLAPVLSKKIEPEHVALFTLLLLGPLFALSSPQAKFVTGGVVGNIFGNIFIPAVILLFYRGLSEKNPRYLTAGLFFAFILAYTHHLSTLVLAFILFGTLLISALALFRARTPFFSDWLRLARSPSIIVFFCLAGLFLALVAVPSYLDTRAIDSAIGTPTKTTRTGLSFFQISNTIGASKVALGVFGLLLALIALLRRPLESAFVLGWGGILLVMALFPHWLFLDIPSSRIGSYISYPLGLAGGLTLAWLFYILRKPATFPFPFAPLLAIIVTVFVIGSGSFDNASSLSFKDRSRELVQTFAATEYLSRHAADEMILKDHNYLTADAWMKIFFARDYGYPLSRGLFGRYEEGGNRRERCSLAMISTPNTVTGEKCFRETAVRYIVVNPIYDSAQFEKTDGFSKLYTSQTATIFERNK